MKNLINNGVLMRLYKFAFKSIVFLFVLFAFMLATKFTHEKADPYLTDKYYHAWLSDLSTVALYTDSTVSNIIFIAANTIKAPEPIAHASALIVTSFLGNNPELVLNIFSIGIIALLVFSMNMDKKKLAVQSMLLILFVFFSFYWFVLFNITHRLKIAVLFLVLSFIFASKNKQKTASWFFVFSVLSHFSIVLVAPFLYTLRRDKYITPIYSAYDFFLKLSISLLLITFFLIFSVTDSKDFEPLLNLIRNKTYFMYDVLKYALLPLLLFFILALKPLENKFLYKNRKLLGGLVMSAIIIYFGTSRVLMLIHVTISMIVFFNPKILRVNSEFKVHQFAVIFWVFIAYDIFKYVTSIVV
ncbi:hypothetical protein L1D31_15340 [Vibrio sp. Isolate23]|uniref:hypothetical protein n=1 Tax=Vibrio sp. Isolate23 TaxID=2908533 RepID=UPI001EFC422B|nr:hypothetical protein [Vibrio sp. Isolate23]MCG9683938.1 hypothetical protein [Vibrio sp. Isolate23]